MAWASTQIGVVALLWIMFGVLMFKTPVSKSRTLPQPSCNLIRLQDGQDQCGLLTNTLANERQDHNQALQAKGRQVSTLESELATAQQREAAAEAAQHKLQQE